MKLYFLYNKNSKNKKKMLFTTIYLFFLFNQKLMKNLQFYSYSSHQLPLQSTHPNSTTLYPSTVTLPNRTPKLNFFGLQSKKPVSVS